MDGMRILVPFHVPGTLAANTTFIFRAPCDLVLRSVQATGTNANDALITVGTTADADGYLPSSVVGDSSVPVEYRRSSFTGALAPESGQDIPVPDDTVVTVVVDFDGAGGTAVQNLSVVLEFSEG